MATIAFYGIEGWEKDLIAKAFPGEDIFLSSDEVNEMRPPDANTFEIVSTFVDSRITDAVLDRFPNLKFLTTRSTGYDHIDVAACAKRGIAVGYVPGYGDNTVAEFAFGLILNLTRKIYSAIDQMKERESFSLEGLRGMDIKDRTLGVLGTGRIGKEVIKIAKGFGMRVVAFDPFPNAEAAATLGFTYDTLEHVMGVADVLTVHCPLTPQTHHLINKSNIHFFKRGAYFVNTARGPIVETAALIDALDSGILAGAALDVLEEEGEVKDEVKFLMKGEPHIDQLITILEDHVLMRMPNVLITPHTAFNSQEALQRILNTTITNIQMFRAGTPQNMIPKA